MALAVKAATAIIEKHADRSLRIFDDLAPNRWGQTLIKRREALAAKDESRKPKTLCAWDFLLGVEDVSRQGALRFFTTQIDQ